MRVNGVIMPGMQRVGTPQKAENFVVAIDVSGSVSKVQLNRFLSEIASMVNYYDVEKNYFNLHYAVIRDSH